MHFKKTDERKKGVVISKVAALPTTSNYILDKLWHCFVICQIISYLISCYYSCDINSFSRHDHDFFSSCLVIQVIPLFHLDKIILRDQLICLVYLICIICLYLLISELQKGVANYRA